MAIRSTGIWIGLAALLACSGVCAVGAQESGYSLYVPRNRDLPDWRTIDAQLYEKLDKIELSQLARAQAKAPPTQDMAQLMERLDIFVRAGDRKQSDLIIQALAHTALARDYYQPGSIADFLVAHGEWNLARHLLDVCPLAMPSSAQLFVAHFEMSPDFPDLDRWLADPKRLNSAWWFPIILEYHRATGTLRPLFDARAAEVRAHPQDIARIEALLAVAQRFERTPNLAWLPTVCHFSLVAENLTVGNRLSGRFADVGIVFLERALQMPYTFDDTVWLELQYGAPPADFRNGPTEENIRMQIKYALAERYRAVGQAEKAQKLMEEFSVKPPPNSPEGAGGLGGQSPPGASGGFGSPSGGRVSEQPVPPAEPENKNDYRYWLTRANDYVARKEPEQAEEAFRKALELTPRKPGENEGERLAILNIYVEFLQNRKNPAALAEWLRSELKMTPIGDYYARALLALMVDRTPPNNPDFLPTNETLWRYLEARPKWEYQETRVLNKMVMNVPYAEQDAVWTRAEKLAKSDPDREKSLSSVMQSSGANARVIPLLQEIARQTKRVEDQQAAALAELNLAITRMDWPRIRTLWPELSKGLRRDILDQWNERLLLETTRERAFDDAMGFFATWTRYDHNIFLETGDGKRHFNFVITLAKFGLRARLRRFYQEMALAEPNCHVPQDILPFLQEPLPAKPKPENPANARLSDPLTLDLKQVSLEEAVRALCTEAQVPYIFRPDGQMTNITLSVKREPFPVALKHLLHTRGEAAIGPCEVRAWVSYRVENGVYLFDRTEGVRMPNERVTLDLKSQDLTSALQAVCDQAEISYVFALQGCVTQRVTLALKDAPLDQAVQRILDAAHSNIPLHTLLRRGFLIVNPESGPQVAGKPRAAPTAQRLKSPVTSGFRDMNLSLCLEAVLNVLGINYSVSEVSRYNRTGVRTAVADLPAQVVLERLLKLSRYPSTYWIQADTLWIGLRDNAPE